MILFTDTRDTYYYRLCFLGLTYSYFLTTGYNELFPQILQIPRKVQKPNHGAVYVLLKSGKSTQLTQPPFFGSTEMIYAS